MEEITKEKDLLEIIGGFNVTGAILNAFKGCANTIMDIGRSLGNSIRRLAYGSLCKI